MITVITCTGHRPEAFELCRKYISNQTVKVDQWIVVDDSISPKSKIKINLTIPGTNAAVIPGPVLWEEGVNTQRPNMEAALKLVKGDHIFIMEDDEFYKPNYIQTMLSALQTVEIVGEGNAKYFNLQMPGYKEMNNLGHASLCQTAMRKSMLQYLKNSVTSGELYFDIHLWKQVREKRIPHAMLNNLNLCVGIKGMPGRAGIGTGHKTNDFFIDPSGAQLRKWIGQDFELYRPYLKVKNYEKSKTKIGDETQSIRRPSK